MLCWLDLLRPAADHHHVCCGIAFQMLRTRRSALTSEIAVNWCGIPEHDGQYSHGSESVTCNWKPNPRASPQLLDVRGGEQTVATSGLRRYRVPGDSRVLIHWVLQLADSGMRVVRRRPPAKQRGTQSCGQKPFAKRYLESVCLREGCPIKFGVRRLLHPLLWLL